MFNLESHFVRNPEIGFLTDPAGVIQAATAGAERTLGYGPGELRGLDLFRLNEGEGLRALLDRPATSRWKMDLVLRLRPKTGPAFTARAVAAPLIEEAGEPHGWMVWAQDLLEAFDQARGTQTVLDALVDSIGAALWSFDPGGTVLTWGPACESFFGHPKASMEGKTAAEALFPSPGEYRRVVREVDERGRFSGEMMLAGRLCHFLLTRLVVPSGGAPLGYTAVAFDLSERKRAEEFQRVLFEQAGEAMVVVDMETGRLLDCNAKACGIHGYGRDEMLRLSIADLVGGADMPRLRDTMGKMLQEAGHFVDDRAVHRRKDGTLFPCEINVRVVSAGGRSFTIGIIRDLTEKHRAAELFRVLFERSSDGAYLVDDEGLRVIEVNDEICRLLGYTRGEMLSLTVRDITPPAYRDRIEGVRRSVKVERPFERTRRTLFRKDGREILTDHMISRMEYGGRIYYLASARDVTDAVRTERELEESRALLEKFRDEAPDPMYILDGEGRIQYLNASACRALGRPGGDLLGRSFAEVTPPDRLELNLGMFRRALAGEAVRFRTEVLGTDGARVPIEINGGPLRAAGRPGAMGVARLIADQLRLEEELKEARSFLEHVMEGAGDGFVLTDDRGVVVIANRSAVELLGIPRDVLLGRHFLDFTEPQEKERLGGYFARLQSGEPVRIQLRHTTGGGDERTLDVSASPLERLGKKYVFAILRDMTERARAEKALRKAHDELARANAKLQEEIAERRRAEEGLKLYRQILAHAREGVVILDDRHIVLEQNEAHRQLLGFSDEEVVGKTPAVFAPEFPSIREKMGAEGGIREEVPNRTKAGRDLTVDASIFPVYDDAGKVRCHVVIKRDVTERKRADERLREEVAERRRAEETLKLYREALAHSNDAVIIVDPQVVILEQNEAHRKLLGYPDEEVVGKTPAVFAPNYQMNMEIVRSQGWVRREIVNRTREGKELAVDMSLFPVRDDAGAIRWYVAVKRDVTERRQAEERLREEVAERRRAEEAARESEEKWQSLVTNAPDIILTVDREGTIRFINRTIEGFDRRHVIGTRIFDFIPPDYRELARERLDRVFATGEPAHYETAGAGPAGETAWYTTRIGPIKRGGEVAEAILVATDITPRKRAEERVAALAEELSLLLANTSDFVYRHDARGIFTYVSPSVEQITGYTTRQWLKHYTETMTDNPINQQVIEHTEETLRTGVQSPPYLVEVRHREGRPVLLEVNERAYWEGGKVGGIVGVARDVTERRRAEERTAAQHAVTRILAETPSLQEAVPRFLQALGEHLGWQAGVFWKADAEAGVLRCARLWHESSFHPGDAAGEVEKRALRPGEWLPGRVWAGGSPVWIPDMAKDKEGALAAKAGLRAAFAFPVRGTEGILGVVELLRKEAHEPDPALVSLAETLGGQISQFIERKRAEEALRFQKALLESQSEAAIDGILVVSTAGKVVSHNRRFLAMWDLSPDALGGSSDAEVRRAFMARVVDPEAYRERLRYIEEHSDQESRDEFPLKDGRTFERYVAPVRSLDGVNYGRVLFFRDVTGRKRAEEGLRRAVEDARRAYEDLKQTQAQLIRSEKLASIGMLVSGVAHEINNPLNVIYGNLRLMEESWGGPGEAVEGPRAGRLKRMVRDALKGAEHARRIIEDFRNFARDTRTAEPVDLNRCLEETLTILGRQLPPEVKVDRRLGSLPAVRGFRGQLNQVFLNLVKNAAEAIEGKGTITVRTMRRKGRAVVEVADTGRGISADLQKKIFEPFFTTKPVGKGLGLGLSISATIVHNHGGQISVRSRAGRGSVFRVELPLKP